MKIQADILAASIGIFLFINLILWGVFFTLFLAAGMALIYYVGTHAERFANRGNGSGGQRLKARRL